MKRAGAFALRTTTLSLAVAFLTALSFAVACAQEADEPSGDEPSGDEPVVTEVPNTCELLVRSDVSELLDEEVGEGARHDVSGLPCVYHSSSGRQLVLAAHLARGSDLEGTQPGITLEHCGAEVVREFDDLGVEAALFRDTKKEFGCGGHTLRVVTDVRFRGKVHPDQLREVERQFHLTLSMEPARDEEEMVRVLEEAANRALARLRNLTE